MRVVDSGVVQQIRTADSVPAYKDWRRPARAVIES